MADKQKTFVMLSPGFPADEQDTACLPTHQVFVRAVQKMFPSLNIIIIAFEYPANAGEYYWNGIHIISIGHDKTGKINRAMLWRRAWKQLKKIKRETALTGLISFWLNECAVVGKYFGKLHGIPHYCWIMGQDAKKGNPYVKLFRPRSEELIAMSDFLAKQFYTNYGVKVNKVITNGIDTELFVQQPQYRGIDVLAAGSLIPLKQYHIFVEAVQLISQELPRLIAMLCGKGPEEQKLRGLIKTNGLENNIHLTGEKQHIEVLALMQQCKVFLHTSNYEGFSTVCLEALYAGAHVISFFSPMEKAVPHWHIVQTSQEMAAKAHELLLNPATEYTPVLPYSMDSVATSVMQLYNLQ